MIQFYILLSLIIGFVIVTYAIPRIIYISHQKKLFDIPNERSAAKVITPNLGGIAIFAGFYISMMVTLNQFDIHSITSLMLTSLMMFLIGLKDDMIGLSPRRKLFFQILAAMYLIFMGGVRISNLHGILGIHEIDIITSSLLSLLAIVGLVNAYNLIDGIDGLAAGIGILLSIVFGSLFILAGEIVYAIVAFSLTGSLVAFFFFNVFGRANKIFMGDTGSLLLGIIFAFLTIKYLGLPDSPRHMLGAPAIALAIMIVPIVDTIRVMTIRILQKRSPFSPDMNHIHHQLLRLTGGNHLHASLIMIVTNLSFIVFACGFVNIMGNNLMFLILLTAGFSLAYLPVWANKMIVVKAKQEPQEIKVIQLKRESGVKQSKVAEGVN
ncbi:MAG TPA: MraY family glycosyltransferase [Prolixibacteraceae bacterium]|nr:MraY family glycosyltransferase [Prolixibacteraceae bacterium]